MTPTEKEVLASIEQFDEDALLRINKAVTSRVEALRALATREAMAGFKPGDIVVFDDKQGVQVEGVVLRINKKSISVSSFDDRRYTVSPQLLTLRDEAVNDAALVHTASNVVDLPDSSNPGGKPMAGDDVEWLGAIVQTSGIVTGEGLPYKPVVLMWMNEQRLIVGVNLFHPDDVYYNVVEGFKEAMSSPNAPSTMPTKVRVSDALLADKLQKAFTQLDITHAPTPEIDEISESLDESMSQARDSSPVTYLDLQLPEPAISRFFNTTTALYDIKPWSIVPDDSLIFGITSEDLDLQDAVVSIIGQHQQEFGFVLFKSLGAYEAYIAAADAMGSGIDASIAPHMAVNYVSGAEIGEAQRKEVAKNKWRVADANAFPSIFIIDDAGGMGILRSQDLDVLEGVCRALVSLFKQLNDKPSTTEALWRGERRIEFPTGGETYRGFFNASVNFPFAFGRANRAFYPDGSPLYELLMLQDDMSGFADVDDSSYFEACDALTAEFEASPEGKPLRSNNVMSALDPLHMMSLNYFDEALVTLLPGDVVRLIFEAFPSKAAMPAAMADQVFDDIVAFFSFLKRRYQVPQADVCLKMISARGVGALREALGDTGQRGMAKTLLQAAAEDGFDITTKGGMDGWMEKTGGRIPDSVELPAGMPHLPYDDGALPTRSATKPKPADSKSRKKKRKASRKARRKK